METHTKYEEARIVGARALQLAMGAPFMIKLNDKDLEHIRFNVVDIAKQEFKQGVIPISIRKQSVDGKNG